MIVPHPSGESCRLVVKLRCNPPGRGPLRALARRLFPLADVVMMRRQLLNLRELAEEDARGRERPALSPRAGGAEAS
jgi:hypothetical protein